MKRRSLFAGLVGLAAGGGAKAAASANSGITLPRPETIVVTGTPIATSTIVLPCNPVCYRGPVVMGITKLDGTIGTLTLTSPSSWRA